MNKSSSDKSQIDGERLDRMEDENIELSDIPELTPEMFAKAVVKRGLKAKENKDDFNQLQKLARAFIQSYLAARQGLTELGILRSERNLQGEYAEWLVANILDLHLAASTVEKAIDATDKDGRTYQIKSRIVKALDQNTSFDFVDISAGFDYLVCVFFSPTFELLGLIRVPFEVVGELGVQNSNNFRFRWNKRTASDARIERLVWGQTKMEL